MRPYAYIHNRVFIRHKARPALPLEEIRFLGKAQVGELECIKSYILTAGRSSILHVSRQSAPKDCRVMLSLIELSVYMLNARILQYTQVGVKRGSNRE